MHGFVFMMGCVFLTLLVLGLVIFVIATVGDFVDKVKNYQKCQHLEALLALRERRIERLEAELAAATAIQQEAQPYRTSAAGAGLHLVKESELKFDFADKGASDGS